MKVVLVGLFVVLISCSKESGERTPPLEVKSSGEGEEEKGNRDVGSTAGQAVGPQSQAGLTPGSATIGRIYQVARYALRFSHYEKRVPKSISEVAEFHRKYIKMLWGADPDRMSEELILTDSWGTPLRYELVDAGFRVMSAGENCKFDGEEIDDIIRYYRWP